ncbi:hypothetical protein PQI07_22755 [Methylobacterium sp. 092160098-2]|uniref:hypothetical protein n=1 Tax=Methylobacterium sp. 092160098-2 TaxID=3025129 RepID=UPI002381C5CB|nr:hypothetical protein [Methylobacterium sp. 092160098-2]MDE4913505.1 hypothetical protein [Methylobacterium sp. 092160098-2]
MALVGKGPVKNSDYFDAHGNVLFTMDRNPDAPRAVLSSEVAEATGMPAAIPIYSPRAIRQLRELLTTMMADTGH